MAENESIHPVCFSRSLIKFCSWSVLQVAKFFTAGSGKVSWYLQAKLDIPKALDVGKKVQINIA